MLNYNFKNISYVGHRYLKSSVGRHDDHVSVIAIMCGSVVKPHLVLGHSNNITCIIIMTREGPKKFTL